MIQRVSTVCLIACVKGKRPVASRAADLYTSPWFKKARAFVESRADEWFILSAEHGLLDPSAIVRPYDLTLNAMTKPDRERWAARVMESIARRISPKHEVVILASTRYRSGVVPALVRAGYRVSVPMEHLGIGEQLSWLNRMTKG